MYSKKEFIEFVNECTLGDHDFLTICMKVPYKWRYRKNLDQIASFDRLCPKEEGETEENREKEKNGKEGPKAENTNHEGSAASFSDHCSNADKGFQKVLSLKKARRDGQDEQTNKVLGEWASKGPRGRIIW